MVDVTHASKDAAARFLGYADWKDFYHANFPLLSRGIELAEVFEQHRLAEQERCAGIAKTGWVSADYDVVGIADADQCMKLCEHIASAIRSGE